VGYQPSNWGQGLSRVKPLALWISILLAISGFGSLVSLATSSAARDAGRDFLADRIDEDEFSSEVAGNAFSGLIVGAAGVALAVLSIVWLYRVVRNHVALGRQVRWSPGWAIGGWFLPPVVYVIPFLVLRESWQASDPAAPAGSTTWRRSAESPALWAWFLLYSVAPVVFIAIGVSQFATLGGDADDLAEYYADNQGLLIVQSAIGVLGCVAWFLVVRGLTARHAALTGEARA
jgi:hypothetical protein